VKERARNILERFPAHMEAARGGKRLGEVTEALAFDIETLSAALAGIRRSRRLMEADELLDVMRIGALHGVAAAELTVLEKRFEAARELLKTAVANAADAEALIALWGIQEPAPRLTRYPTPQRLAEFATRALTGDTYLRGVRLRLRAISAIHARGNGTVPALIDGAANALDLNVVSVAHDGDRYLHTATVQDRFRLLYPAEENSNPVEREWEAATERLLIEENPEVLAGTGPIARQHGELFSVLRRGFGRATLRVGITGLENRTMGPVLVNRDEGHGVGFAEAVPPGESLQFTEEGRVLLGSADVTSMSYAWRGACFAQTTPHPRDFVFDGPGLSAAARERAARFAQSEPAGALESNFAFPHAGASLPMPGIAIGGTRFAFFIQEAHFSHADAGPPETTTRVAPRPAVGFLDQSVFSPGPSERRRRAAQVTLEWLERRAFWVNVWIPKRFRVLTPDDPEGTAIRDAVEFAVDRFRPAGVRVAVDFLDDRWVLGRGIVLEELSDKSVVTGPGSGAELWELPV